MVYTPSTWIGERGSIHPHVWAALILGGAAWLGPLLWMRTDPHSCFTRIAVAVGQTVHASLLIHLTGGRIEAHFYIFCSLAILAAYRDVWMIVTLTLVTALDHLFRGLLYPMSVFGSPNVELERVLEHAAYLIFEATFLILTVRKSQQEMLAMVDESHHSQELAKKLQHERDHAQTLVEQRVREANQGVQQIAVELRGLDTDIGSSSQASQALGQCAASNKDVVDESSRVIRTALDAVRGMEASMDHAGRCFDNLSNSAAEIASMTEAIREVVQMTQLLAVNAAVEAARAGDQGRGFAIVAEEVRTLADRSGETAARIESIADGLGAETKDVQEAMDTALAEFSSGMAQADGAERALVELLGSMGTVSQGLEGLMQSAVSQTEACHRITSILTSIDLSNPSAQPAPARSHRRS